MDPPNLGVLDLSGSDEDALFDTPAARKNKKKTQETDSNADDGAAGGKTRVKESHYTTEEAREAALRRELDSIRNVNKVIEGVVESLQKAKDNMAVRIDHYFRGGVIANMHRSCLALCKTHQHCYRLGLEFSRKQNTISVSS